MIKVGELVEIPDLGPRIKVAQVYSYDEDPSRCPVCNGLGFPWGGWFSCDDCSAVALVKTGETFIKEEQHES